MQKKQIFFKSDFSAILSFSGGWQKPFRLKFWTNSPSRSFVASYDGSEYSNCTLLSDGRLQVAFDSHNMGLGTLMLEPEFYLDNDAYRDHVCNEVIKAFSPTFKGADNVEYNVVLDMTGSSTMETIGTLPAYYMKGDKGDKGDTGAKGDKGADGLTTAVKVNGVTHTQVNGVVDLGNIGGGSGDGKVKDVKVDGVSVLDESTGVASISLPSVPTKTSELTNDSGFLTSHQDISGKADVIDLYDAITESYCALFVYRSGATFCVDGNPVDRYVFVKRNGGDHLIVCIKRNLSGTTEYLDYEDRNNYCDLRDTYSTEWPGPGVPDWVLSAFNDDLRAKLEGKVDTRTGYDLISTSDITKLSGIEAGAQKNPASLPASDVKDWAKADTKPAYTSTEISDGDSNVGAKLAQLSQKVGMLPESGSGTTKQVLTRTDDGSEWEDAEVNTDDIEEVAAAALVETREYIDALLNGITKRGKIIMSKDVVNTLTGTSTLVPLSAWMGRVLHQYQLDNELVTAAAINDMATLLKPTAIAPVYSANKVYSVGDCVMYEGNLFKCLEAIEAPEFFDATKWEQTNLIEIIKNI